jgi:phosphotransferase system  glucose/maltose/N-acetylglucosamine-specific IIC component
MDGECSEHGTQKDLLVSAPPPSPPSRGDAIVGAMVLAVALCVIVATALSPLIDRNYPRFFPWLGATFDTVVPIYQVMCMGLVAVGAARLLRASPSRRSRVIAAVQLAASITGALLLVSILAGWVYNSH